MSKDLTPQNINQVFALQGIEYDECLPMPFSVAANSNYSAQVLVSGMGDFQVSCIRGRFDTIATVGGNVVDDGVCYLSGKLIDGTGQRQLFGDYVPLEVFLSPGRTRSAAATNNLTSAAPSNSLFYPFMFRYVFTMNGIIQMDLKNTSDQTLTGVIMFCGRRLRQRTMSGQGGAK